METPPTLESFTPALRFQVPVHQVAQLSGHAQQQAQGHGIHGRPFPAHRGDHQEGAKEIASQVAERALPTLLGADATGELVLAEEGSHKVGGTVAEPRDDEEGQDDAAAGLGQGALEHEELLLESQAEAHVKGPEPGDGLAGQGLFQSRIEE